MIHKYKITIKICLSGFEIELKKVILKSKTGIKFGYL